MNYSNLSHFKVNVITAIAIAISDSVTVSMGDETSGAWSDIFLVNADVRSCKYKAYQIWVKKEAKANWKSTGFTTCLKPQSLLSRQNTYH